MREIRFTQTGDPWHDWGLCELYEALQDPSLQPYLHITLEGDAGFIVTTELSSRDFGEKVGSVLTSASRWNMLHPRFEEGKKIPRCELRYENGRRVPGEKYDEKVSKEEWEAAGCRGEPPKIERERCKRLASVPLTPRGLEALMSPKRKDSFADIAAKVLEPATAMPVTQGANPLVAKHHSNYNVRGPAAHNDNPKASPHFVLACFCASVSPWLPFVKHENGVTVFLPTGVAFPRAYRLWKHFAGLALVHPDDRDRGQMNTNLPMFADGDEARLLVLLHALQDKLAVRESEGLFAKDLVLLNDWVAIHFTSGKNVVVGTVHHIEVPGDVFPLLKPISPPPSWQNAGDVAFVPDCLGGLRLENVPVQSRIARNLFLVERNATEGWDGLAMAAFELYKNVDRAMKTNRRAARLAPHFYSHFARRFTNMTEEQIESCRKIGDLAGRAFHRDVTIISRLHNASSPGDFRSNLELLAFRLFKASNSDDRSGLWHISPEEFKSVLDLATTDEWQAAAQTISAFASLRAFNQNLGGGEENR